MTELTVKQLIKKLTPFAKKGNTLASEKIELLKKWQTQMNISDDILIWNTKQILSPFISPETVKP